jgi:tRNA threonylcarbamoyladenosine biosynthesis protein TsaB
MLILAANTATPSLSAALWQDGRLLAELVLDSGQPHAETLLPAISQLLDCTGKTVAAIDAYACTVGPGSYTGIRIGVSAIKAMAFASGKPAVGVSTLQTLAWPYSSCDEMVACPAVDARNGRLFTAAWRGQAVLLHEANRLASDFMLELGRLLPEWKAGQYEIVLIGRIPAETRLAVEEAAAGRIVFAPAALSAPSAAAVAEIAEKKIKLGCAAPPQDLIPVYLSPSQAERRLNGTK